MSLIIDLQYGRETPFGSPLSSTIASIHGTLECPKDSFQPHLSSFYSPAQSHLHLPIEYLHEPPLEHYKAP